jgi:hypothetical protein
VERDWITAVGIVFDKSTGHLQTDAYRTSFSRGECLFSLKTAIIPCAQKRRGTLPKQAARVSSRAQDYTAQVEALKAAGCERIFSEKASGKSTTNGRPEFAKLLKALLPGDTVVVTKLDRLARPRPAQHPARPQ